MFSLRDSTGVSHGVGPFVLTLTGDRICAITRFEHNVLAPVVHVPVVGAGVEDVYRGASRVESRHAASGLGRLALTADRVGIEGGVGPGIGVEPVVHLAVGADVEDVLVSVGLHYGRQLGVGRHFRALTELGIDPAVVVVPGVDLAAELYREAIRSVREAGDRRYEGRWIGNLGGTPSYLGDSVEAESCYEEALAIAREVGDRRFEAMHLGNIADKDAKRGDFEKSRHRYEEALSIARSIGDRRIEGMCLANLGEAMATNGDSSGARDHFYLALGVAREAGDRHTEGYSLAQLGNVAFHLGDYSNAAATYQQSLNVVREIGDRRNESRSAGGLGNVALALGHFQEARGHLEEAMSIASAMGERRFEAQWSKSLGAVAAAEGKHSEAADDYLLSLVIARDVDTRDAGVLVGCSELAAQLHHQSEAAQLLAAVDHLVAGTGPTLCVADQARYDATVATCQARLGPEAFTAATALGGTLDWRSALEIASQTLGQRSDAGT